jgi:hypothetical protein
VVDLSERHLGRQFKFRSVSMTTLRVISLFNKDLRGLLQVAPDYMKPVRYDAHKLVATVLVTRLLGSLRAKERVFSANNRH